MSKKHADPEYRRNARIIRQTVARKHRTGQAVECGRCGGEIGTEQRWDVGHLNPKGGHGLDNLAPEHRYKTGRCQGNRAHGGRMGQRIQQSRKAQTAGLLRW